MTTTANTIDTMGRPVRDLRISVTDRCNFRCVYCMPREVFGRGYRFMDRKELLSFEEIERLAGAFVAHGVEKIRITGGEPLLRRDLELLIERLAALGGLDVALTTNGALHDHREWIRTVGTGFFVHVRILRHPLSGFNENCAKYLITK